MVLAIDVLIKNLIIALYIENDDDIIPLNIIKTIEYLYIQKK